MQTLIKSVLAIIVVIILITGTWAIVAKRNDKSETSSINQNDVNFNLKEIPTQILENKGTTSLQPIIEKVSTGSFNYIDALHNGSGSIEVVKKDGKVFLDFKENFKVANGPDLYVYMSSQQKFSDTLNGVDTSKTINIGKLKSTNGLQLYEITPEQLDKYGAAVVIWCKAFGVQFSRADLKVENT
jgi:hypothetical protein